MVKIMKANEAPEKIYIFENPILDFTKLSVRQSDIDIEYTRTDAFIEKACEYFAPHIMDNSGGYDRANVIEEFRKYMKGE